ncbi:hypothetical protein JL720_14834 [Aureococcus anophagefferens]|nr:hypothetical protein JL720_14834 [Aureococcus anophagefferens]
MGCGRSGRPPPMLAGRLPLIVACVLTKHTTSLTPKPKQTKLGPGSMEPVEWALYPRGAKLLDEVSATVGEAFQLRYERQEVRLGSLDLRHLLGGGGGGDGDAGGGGDVVADVLEGPAAPSSSRGDLSLLAALELAARWPHGGVRALVATRTDAARLAAHAIARRVDDRLEARLLADEARAATDRNDPPPRGTLLQVVAARLQDAGCCLLCLNGRLKVPSPVAPGRAMAPLLMSDFKLTYAAEADALQLRADDSGIALYRRWPNPSFRMYARDADHFAFLGTSPKRPSPDQLRAVLAEAHRR